MSETPNYPVLPLNFSAMKALLDEGRVLRQKLDQEKSDLALNIEKLKKHINIAAHLRATGRISQELYDKIMTVSSTFDCFNLQPNLKIVVAKKTDPIDQKERAKDLEQEIDKIESKIIALTQERSSLAVEEQKTRSQENSLFTESTILREQCDELLKQRDALEHELEENRDLLEFWQSKNQKSTEVLTSSYNKLKTLQNIKDADAIRLMNEISALYTTLDAASKKLRSHSV